MKKLLNRFFIHSLLGVCIVVSSFAIAPTASATQWHNYATNMCLTINNNKNPNPAIPGNSLVTWPCSAPFFPSTQEWFSGGQGVGCGNCTDPHFYSSYNSDPTFGVGLVMGVAGGTMKNGQPVITWTTTGAADQSWEYLSHYVLTDKYGQNCYVIENIINKSNTGIPTTFALGVLGGNTSPRGQVVIWSLFLDSAGQPDYVRHPDQLWCASF